MWNKGPRQGPRPMGPPFSGGNGGGGGPNVPYRMNPSGHFHNPMPQHRLPSPNFDYGCGPPPPPPLPPAHFMQYGRPNYENGPPGRFSGPPGKARGPLLPSPPFVPMQGPPRSFPSRGFKRKRGSRGGGGFRGRNGPRNKMAKTENVEFFCDTCDRGFETESSFIEHCQSHKKCEVDGCFFEAHAKIVELHVKLQHETGFAERIMQLQSIEGIDKWKNERKKNFPSAENIAKRQTEQSEKLARGELLETKEFGKMNQRGHGRGRGGYRGGGRSRDRGPPHNEGVQNGNFLQPLIDPGYISFEDVPVAPPLPCPDDLGPFRGKPMGRIRGRGRPFKGRGRFGRSFRGRGRGRGRENGNRKSGVRGFGGTKAPIDNGTEPQSETTIEIKTEDWDNECLITDSEAGLSNGEANEAGVLLSGIVANGDNNAELDSDAPLELSSKVRIATVRKPEEKATPKLALPGALAMLVAAYESEVEELVKEKRSKPATSKTEKKRIQPTRIQNNQKDSKQSKPTLLEMLLAKEIRHERNVILQCVRYIVQNDFFDTFETPMHSTSP